LEKAVDEEDGVLAPTRRLGIESGDVVEDVGPARGARCGRCRLSGERVVDVPEIDYEAVFGLDSKGLAIEADAPGVVAYVADQGVGTALGGDELFFLGAVETVVRIGVTLFVLGSSTGRR
jgi:hypothetical protein